MIQDLVAHSVNIGADDAQYKSFHIAPHII